jgi:hypothetical protein
VRAGQTWFRYVSFRGYSTTFGSSLNAHMRCLPLEFGHWSFATCNRCKATLKANSAHHTKPGLAPNATASVIP